MATSLSVCLFVDQSPRQSIIFFRVSKKKTKQPPPPQKKQQQHQKNQKQKNKTKTNGLKSMNF